MFDIDTPEQLRTWELRTSPAVEQILDRLGPLPPEKSGKTAVLEPVIRATFPNFSDPGGSRGRGFVVAIDGPSGAGKSTLAGALALRTRCVVVPGDDFYRPDLGRIAPPADWTDAEIAERVLDWRRVRSDALEPMRAGQPARYAAAPVVVLDGVYSARPELADLVDLSVHVRVDPAVQQSRLDARADGLEWRAFWQRGERHYFNRIRPPGSFDLQL